MELLVASAAAVGAGSGAFVFVLFGFPVGVVAIFVAGLTWLARS
jgi:hypothetical protein